MAGINPLAAAIQSMMSSGRMGGAGMSGGGFPSGGAPLNPSSGGMGSMFSAIRSMMGNPLQRGMGGGNAPGGDPWAVSRQMAAQTNPALMAGGGADSMGSSSFGGIGAGANGGINSPGAGFGAGGIDPNMLMMHLMGGGSLASLMQMMQARQGGGQQGVMGSAPQMNPAAGMMSAFNRTMAR